jgi:hypothetical protein
MCYAEITDFFTVHDKCSKIPTLISVHFATRVRRSRVVSSELIFTFLYAVSSIQNASEQLVSSFHLSLCRQQHPKCQRATRLELSSFFPKLRPLSNPTNKNLTQLILEIEPALSR